MSTDATPPRTYRPLPVEAADTWLDREVAAMLRVETASAQADTQYVVDWRGALPVVKRPTLFLPTPHPGQQHVLATAKRFNWLAAGRRWRKTTEVMAIATQAALSGKRIIWGAPVYDQVRVGWDETKRACDDLIRRKLVTFNESRMEARFAQGRITYRSLDNPDNVRGHTADGVVIDEAAEVARAAWYEVLRPMLLDTGGWLWALFTPKGMNWVWEEHASAPDKPDSMSWQAPTLGCRIEDGHLIRESHPLENPEIDWSEMLSLWSSMPEDSFRQEILAEFTQDAGAVFRNVRACATATPQERAQTGHTYVVGCDWAKRRDYSVFTVIDCVTREVVLVDRFNHIEYLIQIDRLKALCERFYPRMVVSEETGNLALNELLWRMKYRGRDGKETSIPLLPFQTTAQSKAEAIQALALAFERGDLHILNDGTLINELLAFTMERLPGGNIRYEAPEGFHDDTVMSLALTWFNARRISQELVLTDSERVDHALEPRYRDATIASLPAENRNAAEYVAYFARHEAKKELDSQVKQTGWRPLGRRVKGRRIF